MAGYGGQLVALNIADPTEQYQAALQARDERTKADLDEQMSPLTVAAQNLRNQSAEVALAGQRQQQTLADLATQDALIARAASLVDPNDPDAAAKWDAAMRGAVDAGAPGAKQYLGRYSTSLADRVTGAYSAKSPLEAASRLGSAGLTAADPLATVNGSTAPGLGGGASAGAGGSAVDGYIAQLDRLPTAQLAPIAAKVNAVHNALLAVANSANPAAEWNKQATALGLDEHVDRYTPLRFHQLVGEYEPMNRYLQQRMALEGAGVPAPQPRQELRDAGGGLYAVDVGAPGGPVAKELVKPMGTQSLVTGSDGQSYLLDSKTGALKPAGVQIAGRIGTGARGSNSVFQQKQQAWLDVHPGDTEGALSFAGGSKAMSAEQARAAANAQAARDLQALVLSGANIADPAGYMKQQADAHYAELTEAAGAGPGAGTAPANHRTPAQDQALRRFVGASGPFGTRANPYGPTSESDYNKMPKGSWYIYVDGTLRQKS